jgi:hypothetical protein
MRSHFAVRPTNELVEYDLRAVGEIAELGFPSVSAFGSESE